MSDYKAISCLDLIKHTLLDSFEFGAHSIRGLLGQYYLHGVGPGIFVHISSEAIFAHVQEVGAKEVIFVHTHPLINDDALYFELEKEDPRKAIAEGKLALPTGNFPNWGDIGVLKSLQEKGQKLGIKVSAAVFAASGIWTFVIKDLENISVQPQADPLLDQNKTTNFNGKELLLRDTFPSYFMEVEAPKLYQSRQEKNPEIVARLKNANYFITPPLKETSASSQKPEDIKNIFASQGVILDFIPYNSQGFDPVKIMKSGIEEWTKKFGTIASP